MIKKPTSKSGFTLIEIALALLVASIGLLGVVGLFPSGIQMSKMSADETQAALFAEQVLNGVRAQAATSRWDRIATSINLPPPNPDIWNEPENLRVRPTGDRFETLRYYTLGAMAVSTESYLDFGLRYRLQINNVPNSRRIAVYLDVRPGEFGDSVTHSYYMELYNHGQQ